MYYPSLEEIQTLADSGQYRRIPICRELYADRYTPVEVMRRLRGASRHCFMLESASQTEVWGRYTFLGYQPTMEITCTDGQMKIRKTGPDGQEQKDELTVTHPGDTLRSILAQYRSPILEKMPPFTGGLVGYFSYDYIKYSEPKLKLTDHEQQDFRDMDLMLFDSVIAFDHYRQKVLLITGVLTGEEPLKHAYDRAVQKLAEGNLFDTYRALRATNPSPYMFYFSSDDIELAGASPETLAKLDRGQLSTFPLAGTRPRGKTRKEDEELERGLLADEKERAEHNMLVDLGRNDIGKISKIGTVQVEKYMEIERFSHVMHIGSTVTGVIRDDKDAVDAIDAILPAGTLSGAPKFRACQIIEELEQSKRGIYGGAIGYLDFAGNLDTCIAIRLVYKKNGEICIRSGAGIVADSVPEKEFEECCNKARAVRAAIEQAEEGLE